MKKSTKLLAALALLGCCAAAALSAHSAEAASRVKKVIIRKGECYNISADVAALNKEADYNLMVEPLTKGTIYNQVVYAAPSYDLNIMYPAMELNKTKRSGRPLQMLGQKDIFLTYKNNKKLSLLSSVQVRKGSVKVTILEFGPENPRNGSFIAEKVNHGVFKTVPVKAWQKVQLKAGKLRKYTMAKGYNYDILLKMPVKGTFTRENLKKHDKMTIKVRKGEDGFYYYTNTANYSVAQARNLADPGEEFLEEGADMNMEKSGSKLFFTQTAVFPGYTEAFYCSRAWTLYIPYEYPLTVKTVKK